MVYQTIASAHRSVVQVIMRLYYTVFTNNDVFVWSSLDKSTRWQCMMHRVVENWGGYETLTTYISRFSYVLLLRATTLDKNGSQQGPISLRHVGTETIPLLEATNPLPQLLHATTSVWEGGELQTFAQCHITSNKHHPKRSSNRNHCMCDKHHLFRAFPVSN